MCSTTKALFQFFRYAGKIYPGHLDKSYTKVPLLETIWAPMRIILNDLTFQSKKLFTLTYSVTKHFCSSSTLHNLILFNSCGHLLEHKEHKFLNQESLSVWSKRMSAPVSGQGIVKVICVLFCFLINSSFLLSYSP